MSSHPSDTGDGGKSVPAGGPLAPAPRPRKPLHPGHDFASELSLRLKELWERKRTSPLAPPLVAAFDALELRAWDDNLLVMRPQMGSAGRTRFQITRQGKALAAVLGGDRVDQLLPELGDLEASGDQVMRPLVELASAAHQSRAARSKRRFGIASDGSSVRVDILTVPLTDDGQKVSQLLSLIYVELAE